MGNLPPAALFGGIAGLVVIIAVIVGLIVRARSRSRGWDQVDDAGPSELLPAAPTAPRPSKSAAPAAPSTPAPNVFGRLVQGLARTRSQVVVGLDALFRGQKKVDESLWAELEELLVTSDVGINTTTRLLETMRAAAAREELEDAGRLRSILRDEVLRILTSRAGTISDPGATEGPLVVMVVGVNGAGKTTTIGKLAARYVAAGNKVIIAAGDTFRAAAIEQVMVWGRRAGTEVVRNDADSDPAAVAHDAVTVGLAKGADVVICDTAGRLHTKSDLMEELCKVHRVIGKVASGAPQEVLLVLDSTNGQNAIAQARQFTAAVGVTGIALTKLDGTARGGVIIGIAHELDIPVKLIGIGEGIDDLRDFDPDAFVRALFDGDAESLGRGSNSAAEAAKDVERGIGVEDEPAASDAPAAPV